MSVRDLVAYGMIRGSWSSLWVENPSESTFALLGRGCPGLGRAAVLWEPPALGECSEAPVGSG